MSNLHSGLEEFNHGNYARAFGLLMPIAEEGEAEAQCLVANMYHRNDDRSQVGECGWVARELKIDIPIDL